MFWFVLALLVAMALGFVLLPALADQTARRHRQATASLKAAFKAGALSDDELEAKLKSLAAENRATDNGAASRKPLLLVGLVAIVLPFSAFALYLKYGEPKALDGTTSASGSTAFSSAMSSPNGANGEAAPQSMDQAVAGLAEKLKSDPNNLDGWLLLGRAYKTMERFDAARDALSNAVRLAPNDPDALIEFAEAASLASPTRRIEGDNLAMIERAVKAQPDHQRGLWLLGVAAMQASRPADAVTHWQALRALISSDPQAVAALDEQLSAAKQAAGSTDMVIESGAAAAEQSAPAASSASPSNPAKVTVRVSLDPALQSKVSASDVLFVFARAAEGPKMPLAIERLVAAQLPLTVVLDDTDSMMPALKLSTMPEVVVGARISKSGLATPQSGDLQTLSNSIKPAGQPTIDLVISEIVP